MHPVPGANRAPGFAAPERGQLGNGDARESAWFDESNVLKGLYCTASTHPRTSNKNQLYHRLQQHALGPTHRLMVSTAAEVVLRLIHEFAHV
jgi:hypothetical protein